MQVIKNKPVEKQKIGLYEGPIAVIPTEVENPVLNWHGAKISFRLWQQMLSFFQWTYGEFKSESQLRLFYNEENHNWKAMAMPQYIGTGMSSKEIDDHDDLEKLLTRVNPMKGWSEAGTIHHHCTSSAFQSSIDLADEKDKNGLHITIGHVTMPNVDTDFRVSFRGIMYNVAVEDWLHKRITIDESGKTPNSEVPFPKYWRDSLYEKPRTVVSSGYGYSSYGANHLRGTSKNLTILGRGSGGSSPSHGVGTYAARQAIIRKKRAEIDAEQMKRIDHLLSTGLMEPSEIMGCRSYLKGLERNLKIDPMVMSLDDLEVYLTNLEQATEIVKQTVEEFDMENWDVLADIRQMTSKYTDEFDYSTETFYAIKDMLSLYKEGKLLSSTDEFDDECIVCRGTGLTDDLEFCPLCQYNRNKEGQGELDLDDLIIGDGGETIEPSVSLSDGGSGQSQNFLG